MRVSEIINILNLRLLAGPEGVNKELSGVYSCDLLSWVMSHGKKDNVWITVQTHQNIVAVASLLEFACIIIPEAIEVEKTTIEKANQENIPILQSQDSGYNLCCKINDIGI